MERDKVFWLEAKDILVNKKNISVSFSDEKIDKELLDQNYAEQSYTNLLNNRHQVSHGSGSNLTFQELVNFYRQTQVVLYIINSSFLRVAIWLVNCVIGGLLLSTYLQTSNIMLISDPRILALNIIENHEPMIDLTMQQEIAYGPSPEIPNNTDYTKLRKTVYEKLIQAQAILPKGLHFSLYEGYRSIDLQKMLFGNRFKKIKTLHPDWSQDQVFIETTKLISPVINQDKSKNIPPHSTGGAIDIYLIDDSGKHIDMGIQPKDWMSDVDGAFSLTASPLITAEAKNYREIMSKVLITVGFVNYPTEYWHWSYGDRYWAYHKNQSHAVYGSYLEGADVHEL